MCQMCEQPDLTAEDYYARLRSNIERKRFTVQSVGGSACKAEFSYTIGLTGHGLPELIVLGLRHTDAIPLLDRWAQYVLDRSVILPGETLGGDPLCEAIEVERPEEHLYFAMDLYGPGVRALQLAWADSRGRWPWEPGHRARRAGQPLLGERAPFFCPDHRPDRLDVPPHL